MEGSTKTRGSKKPVPLPEQVVAEFKAWKETPLYKNDEDFLFPSVVKNGTKPITPDMILKRHIRPALIRLKTTKKIGWHLFRHGFSNLLRENKVEIKTAQDLLRHANSRDTMDIYQQTVTKERRSAQKLAVNKLLGGENISTLEHLN